MRRIKGYLIDGGTLLLAALLFILGRWSIPKLLYTEKCEEYSLSVTTEPLGEHASLIKAGDAVYDNITKRKIGSVTDAKILPDGRVHLLLYVHARPRGGSLRTAAVWFLYSEET